MRLVPLDQTFVAKIDHIPPCLVRSGVCEVASSFKSQSYIFTGAFCEPDRVRSNPPPFLGNSTQPCYSQRDVYFIVIRL